jgi:hypothetical protein
MVKTPASPIRKESTGRSKAVKEWIDRTPRADEVEKIVLEKSEERIELGMLKKFHEAIEHGNYLPISIHSIYNERNGFFNQGPKVDYMSIAKGIFKPLGYKVKENNGFDIVTFIEVHKK